MSSMARKGLLALYGGLWAAAAPLLRANARLRQGWEERLVRNAWPGALIPRARGAGSGPEKESVPGPEPARAAMEPVDVWLHGASGGEAYLIRSLLREMAATDLRGLRVLLTACTRQGCDILADAARAMQADFSFQLRYFPLDRPAVMARALDLARPGLIALLETELWPGLLDAAAQRNIPVLVLNGRMTPGSARGYGLLPRPVRARLAPRRVLAVSDADAERFGRVFGKDRTERMRNIKFDGLDMPDLTDAPVRAWLPPDAAAPAVLFASTRKQEEAAVARAIKETRARLPEARIVIAPRHMHRAAAWRSRLSGPECAPILASSLVPEETVPLGGTVIWDRFGELVALYAAAQAVFVGGSLAPLGGQNFLEPLGQGVIPCVGPSLHNFLWAGEGVFSQGLVQVVRTPEELALALTARARLPESRGEVRARFERYCGSMRGGAAQAVCALRQALGREDAERPDLP